MCRATTRSEHRSWWARRRPRVSRPHHGHVAIGLEGRQRAARSTTRPAHQKERLTKISRRTIRAGPLAGPVTATVADGHRHGGTAVVVLCGQLLRPLFLPVVPASTEYTAKSRCTRPSVERPTRPGSQHSAVPRRAVRHRIAVGSRPPCPPRTASHPRRDRLA